MSADIRIDESECCTKRWSDIEIALPTGFATDSGETLSEPRIGVRLYGDPARPVIAVAGGISAGRNVADIDDQKGWWRDFVAPGRAVDLNEYCVLGFDFLPNAHENARTISTADQARALRHALDILKINKLHAFVGSSYGGMVALSFAAQFSERVDQLVIISAADRPHAFGTAIRGVQRRIVEFANRHGDASEGVALARQLAMISYRTPAEFGARFDAGDTTVLADTTAGDPYHVCDYLIARGGAFDMDPQRYVTMSDSIDRHCVDLGKIKTRTLFVAAQGDQISPPAELRRCAAAVTRSRYVEIVSQYGHDAFLKEAASIGPFIQTFLQETSK